MLPSSCAFCCGNQSKRDLRFGIVVSPLVEWFSAQWTYVPAWRVIVPVSRPGGRGSVCPSADGARSLWPKAPATHGRRVTVVLLRNKLPLRSHGIQHTQPVCRLRRVSVLLRHPVGHNGSHCCSSQPALGEGGAIVVIVSPRILLKPVSVPILRLLFSPGLSICLLLLSLGVP